MKGNAFLTALGFALSAASAVGADDLGRQEFVAACAGCHGREAEGNGPISRNLNLDAPALGDISIRSGGDFPFRKVLRKIDGRDEIGLHGSAMPIWGQRFLLEEATLNAEEDAELIGRGRLLSLVYYLESIQQ